MGYSPYLLCSVYLQVWDKRLFVQVFVCKLFSVYSRTVQPSTLLSGRTRGLKIKEHRNKKHRHLPQLNKYWSKGFCFYRCFSWPVTLRDTKGLHLPKLKHLNFKKTDFAVLQEVKQLLPSFAVLAHYLYFQNKIVLNDGNTFAFSYCFLLQKSRTGRCWKRWRTLVSTAVY